MTAIDTNVLARYLMQDDPDQSALANSFMTKLSRSDPGYLTVVVLVELYWVLDRGYGVERQALLQLLDTLVRTDELVVESAALVTRAIQRVRYRGDFADALILERGLSAGCSNMVTFDRKAAQMQGVVLLKG